jgi:DNA-binding response OmpR family regulator
MQAARATVLLVEDDPLVARCLQRTLTREGFEVVYAASAEAGLEVAATVAVDLVVTDYHLPGMDGVQMVSCLRAARPELPVLIASSEDEGDVPWDRARDVFLPKPFTRSELVDAIASVLPDGGALTAARCTAHP